MIQEKGKIGITDLDMTRFFLTIEDAIKLVFKATIESVGGEIFVMKMPSCKIIDLANVLIEAAEKENVGIEILGIRPGEKIHELLLSEYEGINTIAYNDEYYVILPSIHIDGLKEHYSNYEPANLVNYNSSKGLLNRDEIKNLLKKGRFI
jgi:FlaA1/EpsC-like NDP-sugar epimerase